MADMAFACKDPADAFPKGIGQQIALNGPKHNGTRVTPEKRIPDDFDLRFRFRRLDAKQKWYYRCH